MKFGLPLTVVALGVAVAVNVAAGGSFGVLLWNMPNFARSIYTGMMGRRRIELVEPPVCERCGTVLLLRAKQVARARLTATQQADLALLLTCPNCGSEAAMLTGPDAAAALRRGLTYLNLARGGRQRAADAARLVEASGGPDRLIRGVARSELTLRSLAPDRRLALEMAVDEQAEVAALERQWKDAEEIADIADGLLSSDEELERHLRRLKGDTDQPDG